MALIKCSECGNDVSDKADVCPHCGNPVSAVSKSQKGQALLSSKKIIIFLSLIALLVGVIVLVSMLLSNKMERS